MKFSDHAKRKIRHSGERWNPAFEAFFLDSGFRRNDEPKLVANYDRTFCR
jgi:hypothetical protein